MIGPCRVGTCPPMKASSRSCQPRSFPTICSEAALGIVLGVIVLLVLVAVAYSAGQQSASNQSVSQANQQATQVAQQKADALQKTYCEDALARKREAEAARPPGLGGLLTEQSKYDSIIRQAKLDIEKYCR